MLFKEIIAVYIDNNTEPINTKYSIHIVQIAGTYNYNLALKGWRTAEFHAKIQIPSFRTWMCSSRYAATFGILDCFPENKQLNHAYNIIFMLL
jgi:hypothetical protein